MAKKTARRAATSSAKGNLSTRPVELIVRRGALRRFDMLKQKAAELPVIVSWDRRTEPGPQTPGSERRQMPPATWDLADFVVVHRGADAPATSARGTTTSTRTKRSARTAATRSTAKRTARRTTAPKSAKRS